MTLSIKSTLGQNLGEAEWNMSSRNKRNYVKSLSVKKAL